MANSAGALSGVNGLLRHLATMWGGRGQLLRQFEHDSAGNFTDIPTNVGTLRVRL